MTTPTIAADLKTIEDALKWLHTVTTMAHPSENAMVALQRIKTALQPSDAGVAVAGVDDDETEHGSGVMV